MVTIPRKIIFKPTEIENYESSSGRCMQSQDYIRFDGDFNGTRRVVSSITISSQTLSAYLNTDLNPSTPYVPLYPGSPTTKQYVDQHDTIVSSTAPSNPTEGMVWYDTTNDQLKVYDGTNWNVTGKEYHAGEGIEIGNKTDYSAMQGPSPDGFHVPSATEWQGVNTIMTSLSLTTSDSWRINLHMPLVGFRVNTNASLYTQGSNGVYWSSSPSSWTSTYARSLNLSPFGLYVDSESDRASSVSVRSFKDSYVEPTSSWTVVQGTLGSAGIFWNQNEGLISVTNGTTGYTMMDKNLGATTVYNNGDTLTEANMGYMYQWGNNYGFPSTGTISNTSSTQVDASAYGPTNPYSSDTFITGSSDWSSVQNDDLWGDTTGIITQENVISNTGVLSVNGQTGDVTIPTPEESNTKAFYLSSTSDLTNAQAAYDWYLAGKNPIIRISGYKNSFILEGNNSEPTYHLGFYGVDGGADNGASSSYIGINPRLELRRSSNTVTSVVVTSYSANTLFTDVNYSTPYTPLYNGSPATKKYVDDNVNTKTFYLSGTSDLTNAQAAYDWYVAGKNPIVVYGTEKPIYIVYDTSNGLRFRSSDDKKSGTTTSTMVNYWRMLNLVVSNGTVTSISTGDYTGNAINVLSTGINYSTPYTPLYNGSPATKKYVDDSISTAVSSTYKYKGSVANYASLPASGNTEGDVWNVTDTGMNYAWTGSAWDALGATVDMSNYIAKNNTTAFTPTGDYNPATKKYVDDNVVEYDAGDGIQINNNEISLNAEIMTQSQYDNATKETGKYYLIYETVYPTLSLTVTPSGTTASYGNEDIIDFTGITVTNNGDESVTWTMVCDELGDERNGTLAPGATMNCNSTQFSPTLTDVGTTVNINFVLTDDNVAENIVTKSFEITVTA